MEVLLRRALRALATTPEWVIQRIAGPPIERDGNRLAPEAQLILTLMRMSPERPHDEMPIPKARRSLDREAGLLAVGQPIGSVRDLIIEGRPARLYTPKALLDAKTAPTMLFFHGGFHTYGSLRSHDGALRFLAENAGIKLLALDYRLAPEDPFPAGLDDCVAAFRWLAANAADVGADPKRLAVGGDSAGGNLAAATVQLVADEVPVAFQLLVYPVTDFTRTSESRMALGTGFFLTRKAIEQAAGRYVTDPAQRTDPRVSVLNGPISANTPPTLVVTAGFDPLRDEGVAYADKLMAAGVPTEHLEFGDMIHGFFNQATFGRRGPDYNREIAAHVAEALVN